MRQFPPPRLVRIQAFIRRSERTGLAKEHFQSSLGPMDMAASFSRTRTRLLTLSLAVFLSGLLHADALVPLKLSYHRITLSNGRILKDVTLNGFNRESGLIYVYEDRRLKPYPALLFPTFVQDAIARRTAEVPPPRESENPSDETETAATTPAIPTPAPIGSPEANAATRAAINQAVLAKAESAALNHLRYRIRIGSGYATVTDAAIELNPPEAVPGWTHRYRVKGDGFYAYYESVGGVFQRRTRALEILLEAPSPEQVKVLSIDTLWSQD